MPVNRLDFVSFVVLDLVELKGNYSLRLKYAC